MLRGINIGSNRRVPMADLRPCSGTRATATSRPTYRAATSCWRARARPADLEREAAALISERFGFDVPVVVRTARQLAAVVKRNPLGDVAAEPKRYQVSFLTEKPGADVVAALQEAAAESERVAFHGREIYAWHPDGVARSKLWNALAGKGLGVTATARNWTTVIALLEMTRA